MSVWLNSVAATKVLSFLQGKQVHEMFGQQHIKDQLLPFMKQDSLPHILLLGEPGIGKTHMARWLATTTGRNLAEYIAPIVEHDLEGTEGARIIVLLDEAHRMNRPEWLFPTMETGDPVFIAATTQPEKLDPAFRSRFVLKLHLKPYPQADMADLIRSQLDGVSDEHADLYAGAAAGNPRQALRIVKTALAVGVNDPEKVLATARITVDGLTDLHLDYLQRISGLSRPVGLDQLALLLYSDKDTVREHERLLIELELIDLTSGGRRITRKGRNYVKSLEEYEWNG